MQVCYRQCKHFQAAVGQERRLTPHQERFDRSIMPMDFVYFTAHRNFLRGSTTETQRGKRYGKERSYEFGVEHKVFFVIASLGFCFIAAELPSSTVLNCTQHHSVQKKKSAIET